MRNNKTIPMFNDGEISFIAPFLYVILWHGLFNHLQSSKQACQGTGSNPTGEARRLPNFGNVKFTQALRGKEKSWYLIHGVGGGEGRNTQRIASGGFVQRSLQNDLPSLKLFKSPEAEKKKKLTSQWAFPLFWAKKKEKKRKRGRGGERTCSAPGCRSRQAGRKSRRAQRARRSAGGEEAALDAEQLFSAQARGSRSP